MALNAVDGIMAREHGQKSRSGALLNEMGDVVADAALVVPFALLSGIGAAAVAVFLWMALLTEFAGTLGLMVDADRRYDGPMGKSDRAFFMGLAALLIAASLAWGWNCAAWIQAGLWASRILLAPYEYAARLYRKKHLAALPEAAECAPGIWLGAYPETLPVPGCGVLDLTSEYQRPAASVAGYAAVPLLDLLPPNEEEMKEALARLEELRARGPVLVYCALGMTRSALVAACAMTLQGNCATVAGALRRIAAVRPIAVSPEAAAIAEAVVRKATERRDAA